MEFKKLCFGKFIVKIKLQSHLDRFSATYVIEEKALIILLTNSAVGRYVVVDVKRQTKNIKTHHVRQ